jgi:hypothetical protein
VVVGAIGLVTYEIVGAEGTAPLVKSLLVYAVSPTGQAAATTLGYAPLASSLGHQGRRPGSHSLSRRATHT